MKNKLIKNKIKNLIKETQEETQELKIDDVIAYIKIKFPEDEFKWEHIDERSDFYYDHRDIIHLTNQTDLIINYPGGDRFGSIFAEPYTDIRFHNLKLTDKLDDSLYLFFCDKYNEDNKILNYLSELSLDDTLTIEEILMHLNKNEYMPRHILNQLTDKQLQNIKIKNQIISCAKNIAFRRCAEAHDQYKYGQHGGEDVYDWELSFTSQLQNIWETLPNNVKKSCEQELCNLLEENILNELKDN